ncbi:GSCFA domain-containing protein [Viscerimonas tarda]
MEFRTKIELEKSKLTINHQSKLMLFGSCFASAVGKLLQDNKFDVNVNPFGMLYNPASIAMSLHRIQDGKLFSEDELVYHNDLFHSFFHHGDFSDADKGACLAKLNESLKTASEDLHHADTLLITFGTSYVFKQRASNSIVSNCHKFPATDFERYRLTVSDIVADWSSLIQKLREDNPALNVLFTVSPIRHWKDGAHDNQLSKAILLLAIDEIQKQFENCYYFPSYELVLDDLRDYRFYAEDMVHPNALAEAYIWEAFAKAFFDSDTAQVIKAWSNLKQAINHRPFNPGTAVHQQFLRQTLLKFNSFQQKYPYFELGNEKKFLEDQLIFSQGDYGSSPQ